MLGVVGAAGEAGAVTAGVLDELSLELVAAGVALDDAPRESFR